jgi:hypothetical protein
MQNYAKALAELKTLNKWKPIESMLAQVCLSHVLQVGDTPIKFGITIDAPRRNLYESNSTTASSLCLVA